MPVFRTLLSRSYLVDIVAEDKESAARFTEFFVGAQDLSTPEERNSFSFAIEHIELAMNDVLEVDILEDIEE